MKKILALVLALMLSFCAFAAPSITNTDLTTVEVLDVNGEPIEAVLEIVSGEALTEEQAAEIEANVADALEACSDELHEIFGSETDISALPIYEAGLIGTIEISEVSDVLVKITFPTVYSQEQTVAFVISAWTAIPATVEADGSIVVLLPAEIVAGLTEDASIFYVVSTEA